MASASRPHRSDAAAHPDEEPGPGWVSVVLPAYNVARFIEEAAGSLLAQSHPRVHLIAVDDGSTDGTGEVLEAMAPAWAGPPVGAGPGRRLEVVRQPNRGAAAARNEGLARARGDLVAFADADDVWPPDLLARLVERLRERPDLDMTFPRHRYIDEAGAPIGVESNPAREAYGVIDLMVDNPVHSATGALLRASAVRAAGRFDDALTACIDLDYWARVALLRPANIGPTPGAVALYRKREGQITGDWRRMERNWMRVCDKLREAGHPLGAAEFNAARARHCLFWGTVAYLAGDHGAARRLVAECWRRAPAWAARQPEARLRSLAVGATLLPRPWHDAIRRRHNARAAARQRA